MSIPGARLVTSLSNDTVKSVRALHMRKEREETGLFLAEGLKIIIDALELGHVPRWLMFSRAAARETPPASTTATKYRRCLSSMNPIHTHWLSRAYARYAFDANLLNRLRIRHEYWFSSE